MVSVVTLKAGTDLAAVLGRLRAALAEDDSVATAEVGECLRVMGPDPTGSRSEGAASYAMTIGFADEVAFERYSAGPAHRDFAEWVGPMMSTWSAALYDVPPAPPS